MQSFPRALWLDTDGKQLVQWLVVEIETLRRKQVTLLGAVVGSGGLHEIAGVETLQADVEVVLRDREPEGGRAARPQVAARSPEVVRREGRRRAGRRRAVRADRDGVRRHAGADHHLLQSVQARRRVQGSHVHRPDKDLVTRFCKLL